MKSSKIIFTIFTLTFLGIAYWSFPIIKNRYFSHPNIPDDNQQTEQVNDSAQPDTINPTDSKPQTVDPQSGAIPQITPDETKNNSLLNITTAVCDSGCKPFIEDKKELQYCQEVCGLSPVPIEKNSNCDNQNGLDKDYCLKDLAVSKKDFSTCEQIKDGNIKKTCKNRITEDMIDQNSNQPVQ